ncbi:MAG: nucleoside deaminase [Bacilli bacterium]|nr:nucleoside deaminase [Bacilli bacterium]
MNLEYMEVAFKEAEKAFKRGEVPIGAVIVKNGKIIAKAFNNKEKKHCCIEHAEITAIKRASRKLKNWRLEDCDIYVTLEPCPMCASAIKQSRIKNVYSALKNSDINNIDIINRIFNADKVNPKVNFVNNLSVEKSTTLLQKFFSSRRK